MKVINYDALWSKMEVYAKKVVRCVVRPAVHSKINTDMDEKRIKAVPRNGTWEELYQKVKEKKGRILWIELKVTDDLFSGIIGRYDGIERAEYHGYLEIEAKLDEEGNVRLFECVQQNCGDEDGFGVEPDDYMYGKIGPDGYFVEILQVN